MAVFDESKIISSLHPEKAEIGKKYWFADTLKGLKEKVEDGSGVITNTLKMLDKILVLLQMEEVNYKKEKYAELKITVYKALKGLKQNRFYWIAGR